MKKKQLLSGVMALLLSASLCACGGSKTAEGTSEAAGESSEAETSNTLSEGTPVPGGSVVYGMTQDLASLDPHVDTDAGTRDVVFNLYEGLVKPTSDGGFIPAVASDYTISDDAKTYTFTLRDGVTFHDGTPVTIEDVKYSIDRYAEIQGESSAFSSLVDSVEVQDDKTLVVNLKESYSRLPSFRSPTRTRQAIRSVPVHSNMFPTHRVRTWSWKNMTATGRRAFRAWTAWNLNLLPMWTLHL